MRNPLRVLVAVGAAVAVGGAALVLSSGSAPVPENSCAVDFPRQLYPHDGEATPGLVVCTNAAQTATLVVNGSSVVWRVEGPEPLPFYRMPASDLTESFESLLDSAAVEVPSGGAIVALRPAPMLQLLPDARVTVAQLTHDRLMRGLRTQRTGLESAALDPQPSVPRRAVALCLAAVLDKVGDPSAVLHSGSPTARIANAAAAVAAQPTTPCALTWLQAKIDSGLPSVDIKPFAYDAYGWADDRDFASRVRAARNQFVAVESGAGP
jgi:hypothetical protein